MFSNIVADAKLTSVCVFLDPGHRFEASAAAKVEGNER